MNNINLIRSETTKGIHVIKGKALIDDILSYSILHLSRHIQLCHEFFLKKHREGANKQVISSQADSLIKISRIWADFFPANTSNQPI